MEGKSRKSLLPWVLLGFLMIGSSVLLFSLTAGFTFISDEWDLLLLRPGWGPEVFLKPFNEHIIIVPALVFKVLQAMFGMDSPRPMQFAAIATFLACALLLFFWLRVRVGDWAAVIGAAIVLFLGAAFEDLLWAFQIGYFGSLAAGIGALIALDREDRRGDVFAAGLLVFSVSFSSLGIPFAIGAAVEWLMNDRDRRRRWFVPVAPLAFYALWWLGWGHEAESAVSISNLPDLPKYVFDAASAGMTSMLGLATGDGSEPEQPNLIWGRIALLVLAGLAAWRLFRLGRIPKGVLVTAAIGLGFFGLAAMGQSELRPPTSSRYQLPAVIFTLLFCGELLRGVKIPNYALLVATLVVAVTSFAGVDLMRDQASSRWKPSAVSNQVTIGAVAIAGEAARPDFELDLFTVTVPVERFQDEVSNSGSPGYSAEEIAGLDAPYRSLADQTLIDVEGLVLSGLRPPQPAGDCSQIPVSPGQPVAVNPSLDPLRIVNRENSLLTVSIARFGDPPGSQIGSIYPRSRAWLNLPLDGSTLPWKVTLGGRGIIRTCG